MSIRIMAQIFDMEDVPPTQKLILLALADHADDQGRCYPSISRLCRRTGLKERAIQSNLKALEIAGLISIVRGAGPNGCNVFFVSATPAADAPPQEMHPRRKCTTPPQEMRPTPAADAPKPSRTINEPSVSNNAREIVATLEDVAGAEAVASFLSYRRKHKAKALTLTGAKRLAKNLAQISLQGGDPSDALGLAEERGWASVQPDWYFNTKGKTHGNGNYQPSKPDATLDAIAIAARSRRSPGAASI